MTARRGLPLLYALCDEWTARRQLIGAVGGKPDQMVDSLDTSGGDTSPGWDPEQRRQQIAALAAATA